ncbi:MAG: C-type lectin domain-containing protein [Candidatus Hodarchaeota archaeon]
MKFNKKIIFLMCLILPFIIESNREIQNSRANNKTSHNGHIYQLIEIINTWDEAQADCEARNGHLVTITSSEENDFVRNLVESIPLWIGFTDELVEGEWRWVTGESVVYTNWDSGEPNDAGFGEDYAEMYGNGVWNDVGSPSDPERAYYYVCEWEKTTNNFRFDFIFAFFGIIAALALGFIFGYGIAALRTRKRDK